MTQASTPRSLVVDASVAVKWLLREERDTARADSLLLAADDGMVTLFAPRQIEVEVSAALRKATLNRRISAAQAQARQSQWLGPLCARFQFANNADLLPLALPRSLDLGISLFDALYVVLAEQLGTELVLADERVIRSSTVPLRMLTPLAHLTLAT